MSGSAFLSSVHTRKKIVVALNLVAGNTAQKCRYHLTLLLVFGLLTGLYSFSHAQPLNFYYGNIHSHTGYSDGNSTNNAVYATAKSCYQYAQGSANINYFGISEHNHNQAGMSKPNFYKGKLEADSINQNGVFTSLSGMEYGIISRGGHVVVYGIDSLIGWEPGNYDIYNDTSDYAGLFQKVVAHSYNNAFAYLAHMSTGDYGNIAGVPYNAVWDSAIVGMAIRSGPAFSTNTTYSNPSTSTYFARFQEMLRAGYHVAPGIDQDNHNITFGRMTNGRTVVLSDSLTRTAIMRAFHKRRFYASDDANAKVTYTLNGNAMGSITQGTANATLSISVSDADAESVASIKIWYGIPGSGTNCTALTSNTNSATLTYTHVTPTSSKYYYFAEITQADGDKIWTAPIWYLHTSSGLPVELSKFTATNRSGFAVLNWSTSSELNSDYYEIEKSDAHSDFHAIGNVYAAGNSTHTLDYTFKDPEALTAVTYYRLKMVDYNGDFRYTAPLVVLPEQLKIGMSIFPNPSNGDFTSIAVNTTDNDEMRLEIFNETGQLLQQSTFFTAEGTQYLPLSAQELPPGLYIVRLSGTNGIDVISSRFIRE